MADSSRTIFGVPTGTRLSVRVNNVGLAAEQGGVLVDREMVIRATASDEIERFPDGATRRRFVDADPPLTPGNADVWLTDADIVA